MIREKPGQKPTCRHSSIDWGLEQSPKTEQQYGTIELEKSMKFKSSPLFGSRVTRGKVTRMLIFENST